MRKRFCLLPALALALLCACSKGAAKTPPTRPADFTSTERQFNTPADGDTIAIFDTSLGEVRAVLYPDAAPMAVYNFVGLARSGYYDNTTIWRSEYGFAVQGGDATGTGTGGSTIWSNNPYPPEASADLKHYAGALCAAFAAGGDVTGGNSQFYFVTALPDSVSSSDRQAELTANGYTDAQIAAYAAVGGLPYLDNTDTVFGQVYQGMDVVDAMACVDTVKDDDGNDTYRWVPRRTAKLLLSARLPSYAALSYGIGARWQSDISNVESSGFTVRQGSYAVADAFVGWDFLPNASLRLNVKNIGNEKYINTLRYSGYYGAPRSYTLSMDWRF